MTFAGQRRSGASWTAPAQLRDVPCPRGCDVTRLGVRTAGWPSLPTVPMTRAVGLPKFQ